MDAKVIHTYIEVLKWLRSHWRTKEEQRFIDDVEKTIRYILKFPQGFRSAGHARSREAPIKPYDLLLYRIDPKAIVIIGLFDMRKHQKALRALKRGWNKE